MASSGENPRKRKDRLPKDRQDAHIGVDNEPGTPEAGTHEDEEQEEVFEIEHQEVEEVEEQLADEALKLFHLRSDEPTLSDDSDSDYNSDFFSDDEWFNISARMEFISRYQ